jgi:RND family efflux transporter MFP subunit
MRLSVIFVAIGLLGAAACSRQEKAPEAQATPQGGPISVKTVHVSEAEWPSSYEAIGTVRARVTTQVASRMMGYVREVNVRAGDRVEAGQRLVILDSRDQEVRERQASAALEEARSTTAEADQAAQAARANLDLAQATFGRMQDLHNKASISNQEFDEATAKVRVARANLDMAQARRTQIDSRIAQAQQEVNAAQVQASYAALAAPFSGVITARNVEPGNLAVPGSPLLTLEQEGSYELDAPVEEASLSKVRVGQTVEVQLDTANRSVRGRVREIAPAVDAASRSFTVKVALPAMAQIRSGVSGRAQFVTGSRKVIAVPAAAIVPRGQMQWIFVVDQGVARARIITTGGRSADMVEVLSGLSAGETVIAPAPSGLLDGARVEVRQ